MQNLKNGITIIIVLIWASCLSENNPENLSQSQKDNQTQPEQTLHLGSYDLISPTLLISTLELKNNEYHETSIAGSYVNHSHGTYTIEHDTLLTLFNSTERAPLGSEKDSLPKVYTIKNDTITKINFVFDFEYIYAKSKHE